MQALVSGRAGVAILLDGDELRSIGLDPVEPPILRSSRDVRFLLGDVRDVEVLEDTDLATVRQRLADTRAGDDALQLALLLLDTDVSHPTRERVAGALEGLLGREVVRRFVEGVLFACPVPPFADLAGARGLATRAPVVAVLLDELAGAGDAIEEVWRAWEALPGSLFQGEDDRAAKRVRFVRAGVFRQLVGARRDRQGMDAVAARVLRLPEVLAVREHLAIVQTWIAPLRAPVSQLAAPLENTRRSVAQVAGSEKRGHAKAADPLSSRFPCLAQKPKMRHWAEALRDAFALRGQVIQPTAT